MAAKFAKAGVVIVGLATVFAFLWAIYSDNNSEKTGQIQIALLSTQNALSEESNRLLSTRGTVDDNQRAQVEAQSITKTPMETLDSTAPAPVDFDATRQSIDEKQKEINATQTVIAQALLIPDCTSDENVPPPTGLHPDIDKEICIPKGMFARISSDPARFEIAGIYNERLPGFNFALYGPVRFTISGVSQNNVWLDASSDYSLLGKDDGNKSIHLVYRDGKVCQYSDFDGTKCP